MENEDLEELEIKYKELGEKIENLKNKKKCKRLRAENHSIYYFINDYGNISFKTENHINIDDFRYKTRNYFKTREEAQEHLDNINTYYDLMNLAEELNNGRKINWNRSIKKYYIVFDFQINVLKCIEAWDDIEFMQIYCLDESFLHKAIKTIGKERLEKLFKNS